MSLGLRQVYFLRPRLPECAACLLPALNILWDTHCRREPLHFPLTSLQRHVHVCSFSQKINIIKFSKSKKGLECNSVTSQHEQTPGSISNYKKRTLFKKERVNLYGIRGDPCDSCSWVWTYLVASAVYAVTCLCPPRSSGMRKQQTHESSRPLSIERPGAVHPWVSAQLRNSVQPSHLFIQDPTMPPNPAPNPLTQLEEARRRLEEEEKRANKLPSKQR